MTELKRGFKECETEFINAEAETLYAKQVLNFRMYPYLMYSRLNDHKEFLNAASTKLYYNYLLDDL